MLTTGTVLGLCGDSLTFIGGVILAIDALGKHREFKKIQRTAKAVADPILANIRLTKNGIALRGKDDVEEVFIYKSVSRALLGSIVIAIGFICLLLARLHEISIATP